MHFAAWNILEQFNCILPKEKLAQTHFFLNQTPYPPLPPSFPPLRCEPHMFYSVALNLLWGNSTFCFGGIFLFQIWQHPGILHQQQAAKF